MIKKQKVSKDNIVKFPSKLTDLEKEIDSTYISLLYICFIIVTAFTILPFCSELNF